MRILSYDHGSQTLVVELSKRQQYEVFEVPVSIFEALQRSAPLLDYFNAHIWGSKFEHNSHWQSLQSLLEYMGEHMDFDPPVGVQSTLLDDDTPLHVACVWGDVGAVDLLIEGGADVNARGDLGTTPLYNAVSFGWVRCVDRLLKAGATADDPNELEHTAREMAFKSDDPRLAALFR